MHSTRQKDHVCPTTSSPPTPIRPHQRLPWRTRCWKDGGMGQRRWRTRERERVTHIRSAVNSTDRTRIAGRRGRKVTLCPRHLDFQKTETVSIIYRYLYLSIDRSIDIYRERYIFIYLYVYTYIIWMRGGLRCVFINSPYLTLTHTHLSLSLRRHSPDV